MACAEAVLLLMRVGSFSALEFVSLAQSASPPRRHRQRCRNDREALFAKREAFRRVRPQVLSSDDGGHRIDNSPIFSVQPRRITQPLQREYCATARTPARELRRRKSCFTWWLAQNYPVYRKRVATGAGRPPRRFPSHRCRFSAGGPRSQPRRGSLTRNPGTRPFAVATDPAEAGSDAKPIRR